VLFGIEKKPRVQIRDFGVWCLEDDFEQSAALSGNGSGWLWRLIAGTEPTPNCPDSEPVGFPSGRCPITLNLSPTGNLAHLPVLFMALALALMLRPVRSGPARARFLFCGKGRRLDLPGSGIRVSSFQPSSESPVLP